MNANAETQATKDAKKPTSYSPVPTSIGSNEENLLVVFTHQQNAISL
jgi:hypothetical protein